MKKRPFHETIVEAIERASSEQLEFCIAPLLKETVIPEGHEQILTAWRRRRQELEWPIEKVLGVQVVLMMGQTNREQITTAAVGGEMYTNTAIRLGTAGLDAIAENLHPSDRNEAAACAIIGDTHKVEPPAPVEAEKPTSRGAAWS